MARRIAGAAALLACWLAAPALAERGPAILAPPGAPATVDPATPFQRMMIAPGCIDLSPGNIADVPAYCLDPSARVPAAGDVFGRAAPALGETRISTGRGASLTLGEALARRVIQIEGAGDHLHVRLRNLTGHALRVCMVTPTVVTAAGAADDDLRLRYRDMTAIVTAAAPADLGEPAAAGDVQRRLWRLTERPLNGPAATCSSGARFELCSRPGTMAR